MNKRIGAHLAELRKQQGLTQGQLAKVLGVSPAAVSKWETDASYPDITLLAPLARALKVNLDTLLNFETDLSHKQLEVEIRNLIAATTPETMAHAADKLRSLLQQYPSSIPLKYNAVGVLDHFLVLTAASPDAQAQQTAWRTWKIELLREIRQSRTPEYWQLATTGLAALAIQDQRLDDAEALLQELPQHTADTTSTWMQLHLAKGETSQAVEVVQKRLYYLVSQMQLCLIFLLGEDLQPDPAKALQIGNIYRAVENLFQCGESGDGLFVELHRRAGNHELSLESLCQYIDVITGPVRQPTPLLFSELQKTFHTAPTYPAILRTSLLQALEHDVALENLRGTPAFEAAVQKLRNSLAS